MVCPLPDTASDQTRIPVKKFLIIIQVPRSVSHGMSILTEEERTAVILLTVCDQVGKLPVHMALHIVHRRGVQHVGTLIMDQSFRITLFCPAAHIIIMTAVTGLISDGPHDNTAGVLVPFYHAAHALHEGLTPVGMVGRPGAVVHVVAPESLSGDKPVHLDICLVHYIESQPVALADKLRSRRIMGGADGVDVQFFHKIEVSADILKTHDMTFDRIGIMMVHTFQLYGNAIDQKLAL